MSAANDCFFMTIFLNVIVCFGSELSQNGGVYTELLCFVLGGGYRTGGGFYGVNTIRSNSGFFVIKMIRVVEWLGGFGTAGAVEAAGVDDETGEVGGGFHLGDAGGDEVADVVFNLEEGGLEEVGGEGG